MKVLVLGTSHSGSVRAASDWIATAFPSLDVSYFGLAGRFHTRAVYKDGIFGPAPEDTEACKSSEAWNDAQSVDLTAFDHVIHIGSRFAMADCVRLLADYDTLESPERISTALMSQAAAEALVAAAVTETVQRLHALFGDAARLTFSPAPYPLARSWKPGPGHERALSELNGRTAAAFWAERYDGIIEAALHEVGYGFVAQPMNTRKAPFSTSNTFARADTAPAGAGKNVDNRHMNEHYGQHLFAAFADQILGLAPTEQAKSPEGAKPPAHTEQI